MIGKIQNTGINFTALKIKQDELTKRQFKNAAAEGCLETLESECESLDKFSDKYGVDVRIYGTKRNTLKLQAACGNEIIPFFPAGEDAYILSPYSNVSIKNFFNSIKNNIQEKDINQQKASVQAEQSINLMDKYK